MKNNSIILKLAVAAVAVMSLAGCKDFLNVEVIGKSTIATHFSEYGGCASAGEGLHSEILKFYGSYYIKYGDLCGNTLRIDPVNADEGEILLFNHDMKPEYTSTYPRTLWNAGYSIATSANNIIYYVPKYKENARTDDERKGCDRITGWAYFARALAFFNLCNCYAQPYIYTPDASHMGVPTVTRVPGFDEAIPRKSVAEVYNQVISDLLEARDLLGEESKVTDCTHINSIACEALLARVYLYKGDWANAEKYSKMVMDKVPLCPASDYERMFRNPKNCLGSESIFRLNAYDSTTSMLSDFDPTSTPDFYPDETMLSYYDADDVRLKLFTYVVEDCEEEAYRGKTFRAVCKCLPFKSVSDEKYKHPYNFVLRCSEMYLIHAEAVNNGKHDQQAAADDLKTLIARARGIDKSEVALSWNGEAGMDDLIAKERVKELCYEGHDFFDILRRGKDLVRSATSNATLKKMTYPDYRFILPINQIEMEANENMEQNENY